jgi:hypothetical protein
LELHHRRSIECRITQFIAFLPAPVKGPPIIDDYFHVNGHFPLSISMIRSLLCLWLPSVPITIQPGLATTLKDGPATDATGLLSLACCATVLFQITIALEI